MVNFEGSFSAGVARVSGRIVLIAVAVALVVLFVRGYPTIASARELGWFDGSGPQVCTNETQTCIRLLAVIRYFYAPVPVLACLALVWCSRTRGPLLTEGDEDARAARVVTVGWQRAVTSSVVVAGAFSSMVTLTLPDAAWIPMWLAPLLLVFGLFLLVAVLLWRADRRPREVLSSSSMMPRHPAIAAMAGGLRQQRVSVAVVVVFSLFFLVSPQTSGQALDALRAWDFSTSAGRTTIVLNLLTALLLTLMLRRAAEDLEERAARAPSPPSTQWVIRYLAVAVVVGVGAFGLWVRTSAAGGLVSLCVVLAVLLALYRIPSPVPDGHSKEDPASVSPSATVGRVATAVPLSVIATGLVVVATDRFVIAGHSRGPLVATCAVTIVLAALCVGSSDRVRTPERRRTLLRHVLWPPRARPVAARAFYAVVALVPLLTISVASAPVTEGVAWLAAIAALGVVVSVAIGRPGLAMRHVAGVTVAVSLMCAVAVNRDALVSGRVLGVITFVCAACAFLVFAGLLLSRASYRWTPPGVLRWLGARSVPVLTPVLAWWLLAGAMLPDELHDIGTVPRESPATATGEAPTLAEAFATWVRAQPDLASASAGTADQASDQTPVPLMLVNAHGGGIRAAYWTALVLDCVVAREPEPGLTRSQARTHRPCSGQVADRTDEDRWTASRRLFLASGVSGGSVGLAAYAQEQLRNGLDSRTWMDRELGRDFAGATIGWGIFHDLPNHLVGGSRQWCDQEKAPCFWRDRAAVVEDRLDEGENDNGGSDLGTPSAGEAPAQLRRTWDDRTSTNVIRQAAAERVPLLVFNSTLAGGQHAVVTSAAKLGHHRLALTDSSGVRASSDHEPLPLTGALESVDLLCSDRDMRLSTAAVLSARFPVVSPSGRLQGRCGSDRGQLRKLRSCIDTVCTMQVVDGGYLDNSGMLTLSALWPELRHLVSDWNNTHDGPDIAPFVMDLDNSYRSQDPNEQAPDLLAESLVPGKTASVRGAVQEFARGRLYSGMAELCVTTYAPSLQPLPSAPLGWTLSTTTQQQLRFALDDPQRDGGGKSLGRRQNLRMVQSWLSADRPPPRALRLLRGCVPR